MPPSVPLFDVSRVPLGDHMLTLTACSFGATVFVLHCGVTPVAPAKLEPHADVGSQLEQLLNDVPPFCGTQQPLERQGGT